MRNYTHGEKTVAGLLAGGFCYGGTLLAGFLITAFVIGSINVAEWSFWERFSLVLVEFPVVIFSLPFFEASDGRKVLRDAILEFVDQGHD